jgi:uncharacterized protein (TIGR00156 family)
MKSKVIAIALSLIILPTAVMAGDKGHREESIAYTGPVELTNVAALGKDSRLYTDEDIILEGYIIRQVRKDEFIFSDGDGEIRIELDDDIQLTGSIDDKSKVRLYGEYEGGQTPKVEVEQIQIL